MSAWPQQSPAAMNAYYGNPDPNGDGVPDRAWEDANIVSIAPPYGMVLAWAPATPARSIRVHRRAADSLSRILANIATHYGSQRAIEAARMHLYGGAYMFRLMRGANRLSIHSWGAAIDLDPGHNGFREPWLPNRGMMDPAVVAIFAAEGWVWGGKWSTPDSMHFQSATI